MLSSAGAVHDYLFDGDELYSRLSVLFRQIKAYSNVEDILPFCTIQ